MTIKDTPFYRKLAALVARQEKEQGEGCGLADALANLRHIADEMGQDFASRDRMAYQHYIEEKSEVMTAGGKK